MTTVLPERPAVPASVPRLTAADELRLFAAEHDIKLKVRPSEDGDSCLSFGRRRDGGFVLSMTPDKTAKEALVFARLVTDRRKGEAKVYAVAEVLSKAEGDAPGFTELSYAFLHATAWQLNGARQFIRLIEEALASLRPEATA